MSTPSPHLFLCGGASDPRDRRFAPSQALRHNLRLGTSGGEVRMEISQLADRLQLSLDPISTDLVEIAAYLYIADQTIGRGGRAQLEYGDAWCRELRFVLPVRCLDRWNAVRELFESTLSFVSGDDIRVHFVQNREPANPQQYLTDTVTNENPGPVDEVVLFSGGLDSLTGAVEEITVGQRRVALVSHVSEGRMMYRQSELVTRIRHRLLAGMPRPMHTTIRVNKGRVAPTRDTNQRIRSFLFLALAAAVARTLELRRIRLYENGVTATNLSLTGDLLGSRASRTAHPRVLSGFAQVFSTLFDGSFTIQNPFLWKTKTEVLQALQNAGFSDLAALSVSCAHTQRRQADRPQCGACSQCVDRYLAGIAAQLPNGADPLSRYAGDPALSAREGIDRTLAERFVGASQEVLEQNSPVGFASRFPEVSRIVTATGLPPDEALQAIFDLYHRHANSVQSALSVLTARYSDRVVRQEILPTSLLGIAIGRVPNSPGPVAAPTGGQLQIDPATFSVCWGAVRVELGNTIEFRLAQCLLNQRNRYHSLDDLRHHVWDDQPVEKNTIQRVVCNLRKRLSERFGNRLKIDGSNRGHYRLLL